MMPYQFSTTWLKRSDSRCAFGGLALQQRDLFGILPGPHQVEAKVGLEALLLEIKPTSGEPIHCVSAVPKMA